MAPADVMEDEAAKGAVCRVAGFRVSEAERGSKQRGGATLAPQTRSERGEPNASAIDRRPRVASGDGGGADVEGKMEAAAASEALTADSSKAESY